ncbi:helix-turn-helix domain-containing protein [Phenylobacterium sp. J367]|uniref:helix-turn-helix domain-containing protein n=1 Tax=Phenylobacterium sp. J367 TaxID=2898435 RepID=UPI002150FA57|nr:helix-turn-helix domain-containing protein [Phenylobacterium sp. J367]MCR5879275.1 helix-turn-helix domain-containing protein [Phenylobacterium sp. J367]
MSQAYASRTPASEEAMGIVEVMDRLGTPMRFARNAEVYAQDDEAEFLYRVVSGTVRTVRFASDGRRLLGDFYYAGDLFGLEAGPRHRFSAEVLTDGVVQVLKRTAVRAFAGEAAMQAAILAETHKELGRTQSHLMLLSCRSARERVAAFLLNQADRCPHPAVELPMGRQDMADYLGLTIETVSRTLTQLQDAAIVEFAAARRFSVKQRDALERLAE